jgi:hypothetical protein
LPRIEVFSTVKLGPVLRMPPPEALPAGEPVELAPPVTVLPAGIVRILGLAQQLMDPLQMRSETGWFADRPYDLDADCGSLRKIDRRCWVKDAIRVVGMK